MYGCNKNNYNLNHLKGRFLGHENVLSAKIYNLVIVSVWRMPDANGNIQKRAGFK